MTTDDRSTRAEPWLILVIAGAVIAALGAVLPWAKVTVGSDTISPKGIDGWEGKVIIALAVVIVILAFVQRAGRSNLGPLIILGALVIAGIALYDLLTLKTQLVNTTADALVPVLHISEDAAKAAVQQALDSGALKYSAQIGIFLALIGGLIGALGGFMGMSQGRRTQEVAPAAPEAPAPVDGPSSEGTWSTSAPAPVAPAEPPPVPYTGTNATSIDDATSAPGGGEAPPVDEPGAAPPPPPTPV